jgi:hypothetical protein
MKVEKFAMSTSDDVSHHKHFLLRDLCVVYSVTVSHMVFCCKSYRYKDSIFVRTLVLHFPYGTPNPNMGISIRHTGPKRC